MKLTRHNGRSGKHGTYNPRHNDRRFDVENSEHIDSERARKNMYWDCYRGFTTHDFRENPEQPDFSFEEIERMEELTLKIEDVDSLIDEVSSVAYDKAVELVTEEVKTMTHQEDIDMIEDTKVWLQSPERKAPKKERDYAMARLDGVIGKIRKAMQSTLEKVKSTLLRPDKKKAVTEEIKKQAKPSIVEALRRGMEEQRKKDSEKHTQEKQKKQNMEL